MERLFDRMRWEGQAAASSGRSPTRFGTVEQYDGATHAVRVMLQPDGTITGWLPLGSAAVGQGWGIVCAPLVGEQVQVEFHQDHAECGVVTARVFDDANRPPARLDGSVTPGGELHLVHKSGARLQLTNDGKIGGHSTVEIDMGNLAQAVVRLVREEFMALYNGHTHPTPAGQSSAPTQQMTAAHLTMILKAN